MLKKNKKSRNTRKKKEERWTCFWTLVFSLSICLSWVMKKPLLMQHVAMTRMRSQPSPTHIHTPQAQSLKTEVCNSCTCTLWEMKMMDSSFSPPTHRPLNVTSHTLENTFLPLGLVFFFFFLLNLSILYDYEVKQSKIIY